MAPAAEVGSTSRRSSALFRWKRWARRTSAQRPEAAHMGGENVPMETLDPRERATSETQAAVGVHGAPKRQLQFAGMEARVHADELPPDYDPNDEFRGLDEYIAARRSANRRARRARLANRDPTSESDSDSDDESSSASSDTSGPFVISRLRALFGDSSDSSSSSSESSEDSGSDSDSDSHSSASSRSSAADQQSIRSRSSRAESSVSGISGTPSVFSPWTPRLSALHPRRRRRRKKHRKPKKPAHLVRASRMARRNARRLRDLAGGVTEYTLFAPTGDDTPSTVISQSMKSVLTRLDAYFQYHRQQDGQDGDLGYSQHDQDVPSVLNLPNAAVPVLEEADLALPSPALKTTSTEPQDEDDQQDEWDEELEQTTGRHMSDIQLAPFFRSNLSGEVVPSPMPFSSLQLRKTVLSSANVPSEEVARTQVPLVSPIREEPEELLLPQPAMDMESPQPPGEQLPQSMAIFSSSLRKDPWWLDIRCPTYKDMQHLSQHFPLHPLTVEDILKQEQREKVESFERLGYYFVIIRALDENYFRFTKPHTDDSQGDEKAQAMSTPEFLESQSRKNVDHRSQFSAPPPQMNGGRVHIEMVKSGQAKEGLEGLAAGSVSLYLVVFSHGVLSFHFEDLSTHTNRVRDKITNVSGPVEHDADWIVHALYDSVVDAFAPYVLFLQHEVDYTDYLANDLSISPFLSQEKETSSDKRSWWRRAVRRFRSRKRDADKLADDMLQSLPPQNADYVEYQARRAKKLRSYSTYDAIQQSHFILRLTRVREVVFGLLRMLSPKQDVVRALRKRLLEQRGMTGDDKIIALYFDDILDHVIAMLAQLQDRDVGLSHTHSSFLQRTMLSDQRFHIRVGEKLAATSTILLTVFICTFTASLVSMNVYIPGENQATDLRPNVPMHPTYHGFIGVVSCDVFYLIMIYIMYKYITRRVQTKSQKKLAHW